MELYRGFWTLLGWRWKSKQVKWLEVRLSHWFCPKMLGTYPESHGSFSILPFWCISYVWSLDKPLSHHENEISWACSSSLPTLILGIHSGGFETLGRTQSKCYCLKFWYVSMMHLTRIHKQFDWGLEAPGMETGWNSWSSRLGLEVLLERGSLVPSCPAPGGVMVMLRLQELDGIGDSCHELSLWHFMTPLETVTVWYCMWNYVFGRCAIAEKGMFKSNLGKFANGKDAMHHWKSLQLRSGVLPQHGRSNRFSFVFGMNGPSVTFDTVPSWVLWRHTCYVNVQQVLWSVPCKVDLVYRKNWYALLGVVCFELWFVVVLVVYDYILRIPQHEQHTGRLFGSCDLGRWTPGWTLRVETSPIQYPNLSFVDDIVDDIIIYHPNSSKFIQHLSISGYHDIIWYHATIRFEDRQVLPIGQDWQWNLRNQPRLWTIVETRHHNPAVLGPQPCGASVLGVVSWGTNRVWAETMKITAVTFESGEHRFLCCLNLVGWTSMYNSNICFALASTCGNTAEGGCSVFCSRCSRQSSARMSFLSVHQLLETVVGLTFRIVKQHRTVGPKALPERLFVSL